MRGRHMRCGRSGALAFSSGRPAPREGRAGRVRRARRRHGHRGGGQHLDARPDAATCDPEAAHGAVLLSGDVAADAACEGGVWVCPGVVRSHSTVRTASRRSAAGPCAIAARPARRRPRIRAAGRLLRRSSRAAACARPGADEGAPGAEWLFPYGDAGAPQRPSAPAPEGLRERAGLPAVGHDGGDAPVFFLWGPPPFFFPLFSAAGVPELVGCFSLVSGWHVLASARAARLRASARCASARRRSSPRSQAAGPGRAAARRGARTAFRSTDAGGTFRGDRESGPSRRRWRSRRLGVPARVTSFARTRRGRCALDHAGPMNGE